MSINLSPFSDSSHLPILKEKITPLKTLLVMVIFIFFSEMIAMATLPIVNISNYVLASILDGVIMILLISPGLYYFQVKPLLNHINERVKVEQALLAKEDLLRGILELLPVGVWIVDKDGKIVHGNKSSQIIWGGAKYVSVDQYDEYKAWWLDSGKPIQKDEWAAIRSITRGETVQDEEIEIECFDGSRKIILNFAAPIYQNGEIQGAVVVNQDITHRIKAEQELMHSHQLIQKAFDSIDILIAYMDREFNFIQVNEAYARAAGHPVEFFVGKNHFDLYPHEENRIIFQRVVDTGEPYSVQEKPFEYQEYPERGVTYWNWRLQPVFGVEGSVQGVVLSMVDVTERKRAELLLEQQNQDLQNLSISETRQRVLAESLVHSMLTLNANLEVGVVLNAILEQIQRSIPYQVGNILLLNGNKLSEVYRLDLAGDGRDQQEAQIEYCLEDFPLINNMFLSRQPVLIEDAQIFTGQPLIPGIENRRSYLATPMLIGEQLIGFISLADNSPNAFNQETSHRLVAFAAPAALAVENARLYAAEWQARQVAQTLSDVAKTLNQSLDVESGLRALLNHLHTIVPCDFASVTVLEDQTLPAMRLSLSFGAWTGQKDAFISPIEGVTDSLVSRLRQFHKSINFSDIPAVLPQNQTELDLKHHKMVVPIFAGDILLGFMELSRFGKDGFEPRHINWAEALADQAAFALQNALLYEQVRSKSEMLRSLAHKLVEIQEKERAYVARELHDEAGQVLSSLKIHLGRLEQDPRCPSFVQTRLQELKSATDQVLDEIHRLAMNMRPAVLDHLGLVATLEEYTKSLASADLSIQFKALGFDDRRLPPETEIALYRIIQEAMTNVIRHSQATNVGILLEWGRAGEVKVFIEDNGVGFDKISSTAPGHLGLVGMAERAEMLGGKLTIESYPGEGTAIIVEVPDGYTDPDRR